MQNPTDTDFLYFPLSFDADQTLEVFIGVTKEYVASLVADLLQFLQTEVSGVAIGRESFRIFENVPVRRLGILRCQLVTRNVALHPPPFRLSNMQHQGSN